MEVVKVSRKAGVMTATLADVENRNALGGALISGIHAFFDSDKA